jgi:hypothetical protein
MWISYCPFCGIPVTYYGQYEGEQKVCIVCEYEHEHDEPDTRFGNYSDFEAYEDERRSAEGD